MELLKRIILCLLACISLYSCVAAGDVDTRTDEATLSQTTTASEGHQGGGDTAVFHKRKWVKTADVQARVKDVLATTVYLESVTRQLQGFVLDSDLNNQEGQVYTHTYTADSLQRFQVYHPLAHLRLKLPVHRLDTFLQVLAAQSDFISRRRLQMDDRTLSYWRNQWMQQEARIPSPSSGQKQDVLAYADQKTAQNIERKLDNLNIDDLVNYATLTLSLTQAEQVSVQLVPNIDQIMTPGFGTRVYTAFGSGWSVVKHLIVGITHLWWLLLLGIITLLLMRKYKRVKISVKP